MDLLLPSLAGVSSAFVGATLLYCKLRQVIPVKVNCWFCNKDSKVPFKKKNSFICQFCQQYNGFQENGDYNCDIPAQHNENLNLKWNQPYKKTLPQNEQIHSENGLCQLCNLNQVLKVRALSEFTPVDDSNFDVELEEFRKRLEDIYGLCRQCEAILHQTLGKQNSWLKPKLMSWRLEHSRKLLIKGAAYVASKPSLIRRVTYLFLLLISLLLNFSYLDHLKWTSIAAFTRENFPLLEPYYLFFHKHSLIIQNVGVFLSIFTTLFGKDSLRISDVCCCLSWTILLISSSFEGFLKGVSYIVMKFVCNIITFVSTFWAFFSSTSTVANLKVKDRPYAHSSFLSEGSSPTLLENNPDFDKSDVLSNASFNSYQDIPSKVPPQMTDTLKNQEKHDLRTTLDSLKISTPKKHSLPDNFNPKSLFSEKENASCKSYRDNILTPSKFGSKIVTQSSWVAGGYWGNTGSPRRLNPNDITQYDDVKRPLFSLSRSSSQSSGFVSQSGKTSSDGRNPFQSLPNSCRSSLCGDRDLADRASMFSEPVFNQWNSMHSDVGPTISHNSQKFAPLDAQSACSTYTHLTSASQRSPSQNTLYYEPSSSLAKHIHSEVREISKADLGLLKYCNPWMAFILGLSISANVFLFILLNLDKVKSVQM